MARPDAVLIAGPTASGKSRLAVEIARAVGGVVVNADSMQVYEGLGILTARPSDEDMGEVEHRLYGHVPPSQPYSAGAWIRDVRPLLDELRARGRVPVVCGGTGLYFKALSGGLDDMPPVPDGLREALRARMAQEGPAVLHAELAGRDPAAAARIRPSDPQRILRALEVFEAARTPLSTFHGNRAPPLVAPERTLRIVLTPLRAILRERIAERFDRMLRAGAMAEALAFAELPGALGQSAGRAIGLAELLDHAKGSISMAEARERAVTRTRQYAKRQDTWFRHQLGADWIRLPEADLAAIRGWPPPREG